MGDADPGQIEAPRDTGRKPDSTMAEGQIGTRRPYRRQPGEVSIFSLSL
jgi:hypothetical protein